MPDVCERFPEPIRSALHTALTQTEERTRRLRQQVERQTEILGDLLNQGRGALVELTAQQPFHLTRTPWQPDPVVTEMLRAAKRQRQQLHETARRYLPQGDLGEVIHFQPDPTPDFGEYSQERSEPDVRT